MPVNPKLFTDVPPNHRNAFATIILKGLAIGCFPFAEGAARADRCEVGIVPAPRHRPRLFIFRVRQDGSCESGYGKTGEVPLTREQRLIEIAPVGIKNEGVLAYAKGPKQLNYNLYQPEDMRRVFDLEGDDWDTKRIEIKVRETEQFPSKLLLIRNAVFYTSERSKGTAKRINQLNLSQARQFGNIGISLGADIFRGDGLQISFNTGNAIYLPNQRRQGITHWIYVTNFRPDQELPDTDSAQKPYMNSAHQTDFLMYYDFIDTIPPKYDLQVDTIGVEAPAGPCDLIDKSLSPRTLCNIVWLSQTENLPEPKQ